MLSRTTAAVLVLLLAGCDYQPIEPAPRISPAHDFTNGPATLPYVLRSGGNVISAFLDFERDLVLIMGAPMNPAEDRVCGGTTPRQFIPVQWVGEFFEVVKQLALQKSATLHVYGPIPPTLADALCSTQPIAAGTGFYLRTDNDFFGAFGRGNGFSEHVHGQVDLTAGGTANLTASFHGVGLPDGTLQFLKTTVLLNATGH
ncbi:MAG TPA: hypothetical protein VK864_05990 [Longimicrobiales bacterium]|nr:hypothetical protein [Longimicrobiales bacterium]